MLLGKFDFLGGPKTSQDFPGLPTTSYKVWETTEFNDGHLCWDYIPNQVLVESCENPKRILESYVNPMEIIGNPKTSYVLGPPRTS